MVLENLEYSTQIILTCVTYGAYLVIFKLPHSVLETERLEYCLCAFHKRMKVMLVWKHFKVSELSFWTG